MTLGSGHHERHMKLGDKGRMGFDEKANSLWLSFSLPRQIADFPLTGVFIQYSKHVENCFWSDFNLLKRPLYPSYASHAWFSSFSRRLLDRAHFSPQISPPTRPIGWFRWPWGNEASLGFGGISPPPAHLVLTGSTGKGFKCFSSEATLSTGKRALTSVKKNKLEGKWF